MLYIRDGVIAEPTTDAERAWKTWHTGDPVPKIKERVVTFQADGDELNLILAAMRRLNADQS